MLHRRLLTTALVAFALLAPAAAAAAPMNATRVSEIAAEHPLPKTVTVAQRAELDKVVALLAAGKQAEAEATWAAFAKGYFDARTKGDVSRLVDWVVLRGLLEPRPPLYGVARKAAFHQARRHAVDTHLGKLRSQLATLKEGQRASIVILKVAPKDKIEKTAAAIAGTRKVSRAELVAAIKRFEQELQSVGDDAQLANLDLQNMLQKQQQTMQMMSKVMAILHDAAVAVIRKLGG